jgi:hypothetical protein
LQIKTLHAARTWTQLPIAQTRVKQTNQLLLVDSSTKEVLQLHQQMQLFQPGTMISFSLLCTKTLGMALQQEEQQQNAMFYTKI